MPEEVILADVISVLPNKIKISVDTWKIASWNQHEEKLRVWSYLEVQDHEDADTKLLAVIENFSIQLVEKKIIDETVWLTSITERLYYIEAMPLWTLIKDSDWVAIFNRGGNEITIPPKWAKPAKREDIEIIYNGWIALESSFSFSTLSQDISIRVKVDWNKFFNKHFAIVWWTWSGKSHTVAKILQQAISGKIWEYSGLNNSHIVLFDIHGEYKNAFPNANNLDINNLILPYWLLQWEEMESFFLDTGDNNNYNQASILKSVIMTNKIKNNSEVSKDLITIDYPAKFDINQVLNCLTNLQNETVDYEDNTKTKLSSGIESFFTDDERFNKFFENKFQFLQKNSKRSNGEGVTNGSYNDGRLDKFIARLTRKTNDNRLWFLFGIKSQEISLQDTLKQFIWYVDWSKSNITIIDLSWVPFDVLSVTVSLISRILFQYWYFYKRKLSGSEIETPLLLVYEEAHKYVPKNGWARYNAAKESIERIAKEWRKYWVTLWIVSQRPSEISETIFSQCSNFIAMRLTNHEDQNYVKRLLPDSMGGIVDMIPTLHTWEAILIWDSVALPSVIKMDECDVDKRPNSIDVKYLEIWKKEWKNVDFSILEAEWKK